MYKSLTIGNVDELPREIYKFGYTMSLSVNETNLPEGVVLLGEPFLRNIFYTSDSSNINMGCLLFINSYTISIIPGYARNGMHNSFFLFDSHCRNRRGVTDSPIGFSVLMQFLNLQEIEKYIEVGYDVASCPYSLCFRVQFVQVETEVGVLLHIQNSIKRERKRKAKRKERLSSEVKEKARNASAEIYSKL